MARAPTLYGPDGLPINLGLLKKPQATRTVTGVRQVLSGHPAAGLDPVRLARLLSAAEDGDATPYLELAEDMEERDLHYLGVLGTRKRAVSRLPIEVIAATQDAEDKRNADLVRDWLQRDSLRDELFDMLDAVGKGYSVCEIDWDFRPDRAVARKLEYRDPRWFQYDRLDGRTLRLLGEGGQPEPMAPYKFVHLELKAKSGLPIRCGLARAVAWGYLFKNFTVKDWVVFLEVFGHPLRLGTYHPNATDKEKETLLAAVRSIASDAAAIIPEGMQIEFKDGVQSRGSNDLFERMCDWIDRQVSKAVLGQTLTTEVKGASLAAANVHNDVRGDIADSDAEQLSACCTQSIARPMVDLTYGPPKSGKYPMIRIARPEQVDIPQMLAAVRTLVPMGLRVGLRAMYDRTGIPEPGEDEELLVLPAAPQAADDDEQDPGEDGVETAASVLLSPGASVPRVAFGHGRRRRAAALAARQAKRDAEAEEELLAALEETVGPLTDDWLAQIRACLDKARDMEDLAMRLVEAFPNLETDDVADVIGQAMALAELAGRDLDA